MVINIFVSAVLLLTTSCYYKVERDLVHARLDQTQIAATLDSTVYSPLEASEYLGIPESSIEILDAGDRSHRTIVNFFNLPIGYKDFVKDLGSNSKIQSIFHVYNYSNEIAVSGSQSENLSSASVNEHHEIIKTQDAWNFSQGEGIVIALTDDGVDYRHKDLSTSIWHNIGESGFDKDSLDKSNNQKDDDENGYIDDFQGWDFIRNDNDPKPEYFFYRHGTFISGILASANKESNNSLGVAPKSKVMPLKFIVGNKWTSVDVFKAYKYATDNGAKIINTSYDVNHFLSDSLFEEAINYAYSRDLLIIYSAGNSNLSYTGIQDLDKVLVVGATGGGSLSDRKAPYSNFGNGVDIVAPGRLYSSTPNNKYTSLEGTSFAAAVISGVAALIWAKNPNFSRDQVVAQIRGTADNIDDMNPGFEHLLGSGRVNALSAVTLLPRPPRISKTVYTSSSTGTSISIFVEQALDPNKVNSAHFTVLGENGAIYSPNLARTFHIGSNRLDLNLDKPIVPGAYVLKISRLCDPFNQLIVGSDRETGELTIRLSIE